MDLDGNPIEDPTITAVSASVGSPMSPDSNHNDQPLNTKLNGFIKTVLPDQTILPNRTNANETETEPSKQNGVNLEGRVTMHVVSDEEESVEIERREEKKEEEDDKIQEYLRRSDTAVIFPEPVGLQNNGEFNFYVLLALDVFFNFFFKLITSRRIPFTNILYSHTCFIKGLKKP